MQHLPCALLEDLREELREHALHAERLDLRVHRQAAVSLDEARRERHGSRLGQDLRGNSSSNHKFTFTFHLRNNLLAACIAQIQFMRFEDQTKTANYLLSAASS